MSERIGMFSGLNTTPGISDERAPIGYTSIVEAKEKGGLPSNFPTHLWYQQLSRYTEYWSWYTGAKLNEDQGETDSNGDPLLKFPLQINPLRNFSRKHAAVLLGEADDTYHPLIKTIVEPQNPLDGSDVSDEDRKLANIAQNIINEVWMASGGRALQHENAVLSQFLGGCVFKLSWQPWRKDIRIPIVIEKVVPDHFLPIWNPKDYWDLHEVFEIYRIPAAAAKYQYGVEVAGPWSIYIEHWTKDSYSIYVDNKVLTAQQNGRTITYNGRKNPWGQVPYVYIPVERDGGSFYGSSILENIRGLIKEFNARMADNGDAIRESVHRRRYMRNVQQTPSEQQIANGTWVTDLGNEPPMGQQKHPPEVYTEDPPSYSDGMMNFSQDLWNQMLREGALQNIAFGEDEGSQRSALTLAFRMWPTTARARASRTFWEDGLNKLARLILTMVASKPNVVPYSIPADHHMHLKINQDWHPMIPRDREQELNEIILRFQAGLMSPEMALQRFGDVRDVDVELQRIQQYQEFQARMQMQQDAAEGEGADATIPTPAIHNETGTDE